MYLYFSFKIFISILRLIRYWNYSPNDNQTSVKEKQMIGYDIHHKNSTICLRVHILNTLILINTIIPLWRISHFQEENSIRGGWMVCKFKCSILGPNQKEFRSKKLRNILCIKNNMKIISDISYTNIHTHNSNLLLSI